jgi:carbonic anhydrase
MKHAHIRWGALLAILSIVAATARAGEAKPSAQHEWDYGKEHGPAHWGDLDPEFAPCKVGQRQSPIDIRETVKADLPPIEFDYHPSPLRIVDNGHTIMASYASGSSIKVGADRYELKQLHFHRPSENWVRGKRYAMEAHLVHADASGRLAVVALLLETGRENALVRELWNDIPREKGKEQLRQEVQIDAAHLLPAARGYYAFDGSLTTPPCSENVSWLVLKQPVQVSAAEVAQFSKLYPNDARTLQALHGRVVRETRP